ncbi:MAG TPA: LytTR family DNA-binding domain-containing protein [Rudaea sp.]|jgi:two-component system LytT family response regulator
MTNNSAPVKTLIVDDEPIARAGLHRMLAEVEWLHCVGDAASGPEALQAIAALEPELVLLDVEMPGLSGIDVLRSLRQAPYVVFTTAYAEHAVAAFELGAIDYLLKPFGSERLQASLERVRAALGEPRAALLDRVGEALSRGPMSRLFVRSGRSIVPIAVDGIVWFEAVGDYVAAHAGGAQHLLHVSLSRLEERLDARRFARIHRTYMVNLDHVVAFRRQLTGEVVAELRDGTRLPVSRAKAQELRHLARS